MVNIHPTARIHPTALVDERATIGQDVVVGPFCYVGPDVKIGDRTVLRSHVTVEGRTTLGADNVVYPGAAIGCEPQDKKYAGEDTVLVVGDRNVIRENCTLSIGTVQDEGITRVGSDNLFMANAHVAHDCRVGNGTILANNVALAGHVTLEDYAIVGGQTGVHQFCRVGAHAMVGGRRRGDPRRSALRHLRGEPLRAARAQSCGSAPLGLQRRPDARASPRLRGALP